MIKEGPAAVTFQSHITVIPAPNTLTKSNETECNKYEILHKKWPHFPFVKDATET